ncbi:DNA polymerase III subunit gamma/tau C-terminal domain-containing protein [Celerinatantimonas sp. YJH-8]|uniref:DNA polymerase III subunit gamma/tau C-terminal domain-containing protein n=1 Tax=Celerinatantimonas sp. YJH-8 TaxID=3228714 RepID=UPI0038C671DD
MRNQRSQTQERASRPPVPVEPSTSLVEEQEATEHRFHESVSDIGIVPSNRSPDPELSVNSSVPVEDEIPTWASETLPLDETLDTEYELDDFATVQDEPISNALTSALPADYKRESVLSAEMSRQRKQSANDFQDAIKPAAVRLPQHRWADLLDQLSIGPRARQVGLNAAYELQADRLVLTVLPQFKHLLVDTIVNELTAALLPHLDVSSVEFKLGERPDIQTPLEHQHQCQQILHRAAKERLQQDQNVQFIMSRFGGELDDDSIGY